MFRQFCRNPVADALAKALNLETGMVALRDEEAARMSEEPDLLCGAQVPVQVLRTLDEVIDLLSAEGLTAVATREARWFLAPLFRGPELKGVCLLRGSRASSIDDRDRPFIRSMIEALQYRVFGHDCPEPVRGTEVDLAVLSGGIVHSVRNPLAGISTIAQLMRSRTASNPYLQHCLNMILKETETLDLLMRDLLSYSAVVRPRVTREDVHQLLRRMTANLRNEFGFQKIELGLIESGDHRMVRVDADMIEKVVRILMENSRHGMPAGGRLTIHLSTDAPDGRRDSGRVVIRFADTGRGISPGEESRALTPFFKADDRRMGLRLAAVKRFVEVLGGEVHVLPAAGLEVVVALPAAD